MEQFWLNVQRNNQESTEPDGRSYDTDIVAKAKPDECYNGIGENNIYPFDFESPVCSVGKPKVTESYVFGSTKSGKNPWFGTAPNMGCLVYVAITEQGIPGDLFAFESNLWVCEYGEGLYGKDHGLPPASGDWRPPSIYIFNTHTNTLEKKFINDPLIDETLGLRSVGSLAPIIFRSITISENGLLSTVSFTPVLQITRTSLLTQTKPRQAQYFVGKATQKIHLSLRLWVGLMGMQLN